MRRTTPSGVRRVAPLQAAVASDVGMVRDENQDRVALVRSHDRNGSPFVLAALADGMGGLKQGAESASLTLAIFIDSVIHEAQRTDEAMEWLCKSALQANRAVYALHGGSGGSTLAAILLSKGRPALWLSVGDSRVYHAAGAKLTQLSKDDTLEGQLGRAIEGARSSDLLQFVGIGDGLEPHVEPVPPDLSGTLLLTTDGVHFISADYLGKVAHFASDLGVCARRFIEMARMLGGPDNASVVALSMDALSDALTSQIDMAYEVWDPFGDLQVILDRARPDLDDKARSPMPMNPSASTRPSGSSRQNDAPADDQPKSVSTPACESAPVSSTTSRKPSKPRGKGSRKAKIKETKVENAPEAEGNAPQLIIDFPHKVS